MIGFQVAQTVLHNLDSTSKNHFLYHDLSADKWGILSWDMDLVFGKFFTTSAVDFGAGRESGSLNDIMMSERVVFRSLGNPWFMTTVRGNTLRNWLQNFFFVTGDGYYQRAYLARVWDILEEKYTREAYASRLSELRDFTVAEQDLDFFRWGRYPSNVEGFPQDLDGNIAIIESEIEDHRTFVREYFRDNHPEIMRHPRMRISEVLFLSEADNELEFIELTNISADTVDLLGWTIEGIRFEFTESVVVDPGGVIVVAKSPAELQAATDVDPSVCFGPYSGSLANRGETLRLLDAGPGYPATVDYLDYDADTFPRVLPGFSIELRDVSGNFDNDHPAAWKGSESVGGTPGNLGDAGPTFIRGDANDDLKVDITDAVVIVSYLFGEGIELRCLDAADIDDNAEIDLSDAIAVLNHLFAGASGPSIPYPGAGTDPSNDALHCVAP